MEKEDPAGKIDPETWIEPAALPGEDDLTGLLVAWGEGDPEAGEELMRQVSGRLRRLAGRFLRHERRDHTLETAELINEAYLRLIRQENVTWESRRHFFAMTGKMMRRILVDHARRRAFSKHGGHLERLPEEVLEDHAAETGDESLIALGGALDALTEEREELSTVVELRYFVGLTGDEIAESLGISRPTVQRRWKMARAWLYRYLQSKSDEVVGGPTL